MSGLRPSWPLLCGLLSGVIAIQVLAPPDARLPLILAAILIGGMPHGGLDLALARRRFPLDGPLAVAGFVVAYLALAGAVVAIWIGAPTAMLLAFLAYSAVHFGGDLVPDELSGTRAIGFRFGAGMAILGLPALFQPAEVASLVGALGAKADLVTRLLAVLAVPGLIAAGWIARGRRELLAIWMGYGLAAAFLPPLAAFFLFFCGVHGPFHVARVAQETALDPRRLGRAMLVPAGVAGLGVVAAGVWLAPRVGVDEAAMRAVFVGFAALTVPHMLLVDAAPAWSGRRH